jgi:hypothetical protein
MIEYGVDAYIVSQKEYGEVPIFTPSLIPCI